MRKNGHNSIMAYADADGRDVRLIEDQLQDIVHLSEATWLHGIAKRRMLLLGLVLKQNAEQWHLQQVKLFGCALFFKIWVLDRLKQPNYFVIIKLLYILLQIMYFMSAQNILRSTVILFEKMFNLMSFALHLSVVINNWQIFLKKNF